MRVKIHTTLGDIVVRQIQKRVSPNKHKRFLSLKNKITNALVKTYQSYKDFTFNHFWQYIGWGGAKSFYKRRTGEELILPDKCYFLIDHWLRLKCSRLA